MVKKKGFFLVTLCMVLLLFAGCQKQNLDEAAANWSTSRYSEATGKSYEETDNGYKGAFYCKEEMTNDQMRDWMDACDANGQYFEYIWADSDSWDMFVYYPCEGMDLEASELKFIVHDSIVKIYVEQDGEQNLEDPSDYILVRIQAPSRGVWPSSSELFVDGSQRERCDDLEKVT